MNTNILLKPFDKKYEQSPFSEISNEDYLPGFKKLIDESLEEIKHIANNPTEPSFQNTIEALAFSGMQLDRVSSIFFNLNSAETSEDIQKIAQEASPLLSDFSSQIMQNEELFKRIQTVYNSKSDLNLDTEQTTLLEETYKSFVRNGALLCKEKKARLKEINMQLSIKSLKFGENVLAATNSYFKHITDRNELAGMPESVLGQYQEEAEKRGLDGYVITLNYPSYIPAMKYIENRELRKELYIANGQKAFLDGENDNKGLIKEIITLRDEKAKLLGYANYADYVLEERMAKSTEEVQKFLHELLEKATPYAEKELKELEEIAKVDFSGPLENYDHSFYSEKLKEHKLSINEEKLRAYFPLNAVEEAVFDLASKLFNLTFEKTDDIDKYHPEISTYIVKQGGEYKALLYTDYHPREGKRAGAWMTSYKSQYKIDEINSRPHISVVCNFTRATKSEPSLLTFNEVTTLFHEFGHAIHGIMASTKYPTLSGTSVKWDFVELPSQFLENYCYEPEFLQTFAKHYKTGEVLPIEEITKLSEVKSFMEGYQTMRQIGFGLLDLAYHSKSMEFNDVSSFERTHTKEASLYPWQNNVAMSTSFSHIFQGGYAAGYYSYKWAEVLDADAFAYFKENGIFNPVIATKYSHLLSMGGTVDPMKLYEEFRGEKPQIKNLIKRAFG